MADPIKAQAVGSPLRKLVRFPIVQSIGNGMHQAMSQKAVTEELAKKVDKTTKVNGKPLSANVSLVAADVKAFKSDGSTATVANLSAVQWNASSGVYQATDGSASQMVVQFLGSGSCPSAQLRFNYANGGIWYRSARDKNGFEEAWTEIYTDKNRPTPADIGAYTKAEVDSRINTRVPTTRKVNGKPLTGDISLGADDVGTYTKAEIDELTKIDDITLAAMDKILHVGFYMHTKRSGTPESWGYPGKWQMQDAECVLMATKTTAQAGTTVGDFNQAVPLPKHSHTCSDVTLNKRFNTNTAGDHDHAVNRYIWGDPRNQYADAGAGHRPIGGDRKQILNDGNHAHYVDVNFGAHAHTISETGVDDAKIDVRGKRIYTFIWLRTE